MIVIIDHGIGNLQSVKRAFDKIGAPAMISSLPEELEAAERIVLPGVGSFAEGMDNLRRCGMLPVLNRKVHEQGTPVLGICLGFQMLTHRSDEGDAAGLGWIDGETHQIQFEQPNPRLKVPHMGWNTLTHHNGCQLLKGLTTEACFYFAHSYRVSCNDESAIAATTHYGCDFVSVAQKKNIFGTQFHPEKSQANGLTVLKNFVEAV